MNSNRLWSKGDNQSSLWKKGGMATHESIWKSQISHHEPIYHEAPEEKREPRKKNSLEKFVK
jgi:hypothetical protein